MRKLSFSVNLNQLKRVKQDIIPALFTEHQFSLIKKRFQNQLLSPSERNEFSRSISKKMKAIYAIMEKETGGIYVYGTEKIIFSRLNLAEKYLKQFSRKFKDKHILISGSFLYSQKYNDIDVFVISKYNKEDHVEGKFHINYLPETAYYSLFFASLSKLCVSNQKLTSYKVTEKVNLDTFISLYQELFNDLDRKFAGIKKTMREFLLEAAFLAKSPLPDSFELKQQAESILSLKHPSEIIKKLFVQTVVLGIRNKKALPEAKEMISSYEELIDEFPQHKAYYLDLISAFKEVVSIGS
ncbi:hypothetical protein HZC30_07385 [Candidatus Woesearchaeota archaeon]|nr:hypothetical protein [Candidatus Woesearchaeota archaeon]